MYLLTQGEDQEGQRDTGRSEESERSQETPRSEQGQTPQQEQEISTHPPEQGESLNHNVLLRLP